MDLGAPVLDVAPAVRGALLQALARLEQPVTRRQLAGGPEPVAGGRLLARGRCRSPPLFGHEIADRGVGSDERRDALTFGNKRWSDQAIGDEAIECRRRCGTVAVVGRSGVVGALDVQVATQVSELPSHTNTIARLGEQIH